MDLIYLKNQLNEDEDSQSYDLLNEIDSFDSDFDENDWMDFIGSINDNLPLDESIIDSLELSQELDDQNPEADYGDVVPFYE